MPREVAYFETTPPPTRKPPVVERGALGWLRENLFSTWWNSLLTVLSILALIWMLISFAQWAVQQANWAVITRNLHLFALGRYPQEQAWRPLLSALTLMVLIGLTWRLWGRAARLVLLLVVIGVALLFVFPAVAADLPLPQTYVLIGGPATDPPPALAYVAGAGETVTFDLLPTDFTTAPPIGFTDSNSLTVYGLGRQAERALQHQEELALQARQEVPPRPTPDLVASVTILSGDGHTLATLTAGPQPEPTSLTWTFPQAGWYLLSLNSEGTVGGFWLKLSTIAPMSTATAPVAEREARYGPPPTLEGKRVRLMDTSLLAFQGVATLNDFVTLHLGPISQGLQGLTVVLVLATAAGYGLGALIRGRPWARRAATTAWIVSPVAIFLLLQGGGLAALFGTVVFWVIAATVLAASAAYGLGARMNDENWVQRATSLVLGLLPAFFFLLLAAVMRSISALPFLALLIAVAITATIHGPRALTGPQEQGWWPRAAALAWIASPLVIFFVLQTGLPSPALAFVLMLVTLAALWGYGQGALLSREGSQRWFFAVWIVAVPLLVYLIFYAVPAWQGLLQPVLVAVVIGGAAAYLIQAARQQNWPRLASLAAWPVIGLALLQGTSLAAATPFIELERWGGLLLTLILTVVGIVVAFPIGVLLALGRRSALPVVRIFCTLSIELVRGVPLVTVLFAASLLVPLADPSLSGVDNVVRAMVGMTFFSAAYLAEIVRGGLQAVPHGQTEAARALGMPGWQVTLLIVLPQALRTVIPAIMGQFVSLFKDTSLVLIIGLIDLLGIARSVINQAEYIGLQRETLVFISVIYFVLSYLMSWASRRLEQSGSGAVRRVT